MKKLMVLTLVLGVAALANAGLVYQIDGANYVGGEVVKVAAGEVKIAVFNTAEQAAAFEIGGVVLNGAASYTGAEVFGANLPGSWSTTDFGFNDGYGNVYGISYDSPAVSNTKAGKLFEYILKFDGPDATFQMIDQNWNGMVPAISLVIPEPITMGLLALGGLFIRRKK